MFKSKKSLVAAIAATVVAGSIASATPASAYYWHHHHGYGWGPYVAGAAGAVALGLVAGAIAESDSCYYESRPVYRHGYFVGYRQVPVC